MRAIEPMNCETVEWRTDGEYAPVRFFINCNDQFWWGTGDNEDLTPENIGELEKAYADCNAIDKVCGKHHAQSLFCCRVRKMRPQGCCYPPREYWHLFDACGPEREVGLGNPYPPGGGR
jgi:hypothetical protein